MKLINNPKVLAATYNPVSKTKMFSVMVDFPTSLLAGLRTHRILTQGAAYEHCELNDLSLSANSARAIPTSKYLQKVVDNPFIPIWTKQQKGMSGELVENVEQINYTWLNSLDNTPTEIDNGVRNVRDNYNELLNLKVHKQNANGLLAPFAYTTCILSGTQWENFFELRCPKYHLDLAMRDFGYFRSKKEFMKELDAIIESDKAENHPSLQRAINKKERLESGELKWEDINSSEAQPEFQVIAEMIYDLYQEADWKQSKYHIPFIQQIWDNYELGVLSMLNENNSSIETLNDDRFKIYMKISASMCAKLSYDTQEKPDTLEKHLDRAQHLLDNKHSEPFSHQAVAMNEEEYQVFHKSMYKKTGQNKISQVVEHGWCYNNNGFITQRYIIENL